MVSPHATARLLRETLKWQAGFIVSLLFVLLATVSCSAGPFSSRSPTLQCVLPSHQATQGGCIATDPATGISIRVSDAYADATGTVVKMEIASAPSPLILQNLQLTIHPGGLLPAGGGDSEFSGGRSSALLVTVPVPAVDFGQLVHFLASAGFSPTLVDAPGHASDASTLSPPPSWQNLVLTVPFQLIPMRSGGNTYHQAPVTKQGIGVRVASLQYSSTETAFWGSTGGASITVIFSGLPADLELLSFIRLESNDTIALQGEEGNAGPGLLVLHIPGMSVSTPAFTVLQPLQWQKYNQHGNATVGSSGTVELEVSYAGTGKPTGEPATLSISNIQSLTHGIDQNGTAVKVPVLPSYQITLPLS